MKLNLRSALFIFFALTVMPSSAQTAGLSSDSTLPVKICKNTLYVELLGNVAAFSANYDRIVFSKNKISLSLSVGAGWMPSNLINDIAGDVGSASKTKYSIYGFPVAANLFWGRKNSHFETGIGLTYQQGLTGTGKNPSQTIFAVHRLGYRYQSRQGGFFFKAGLTPFFAIAEFGKAKSRPVVPLFGIAFGYTLEHRKND